MPPYLKERDNTGVKGSVYILETLPAMCMPGIHWDHIPSCHVYALLSLTSSAAYIRYVVLFTLLKREKKRLRIFWAHLSEQLFLFLKHKLRSYPRSDSRVDTIYI